METNNLITINDSIINKINKLNSASILYSNIDDKLNFPIIRNDFSEETIYKAFIHYCNFNNDIPIDDDLKSICLDKPDSFDANKNITENIEIMKQEQKYLILKLKHFLQGQK